MDLIMGGMMINLMDTLDSSSGYLDADTNKLLSMAELDNHLIKWGISKKMLINTIRNGDFDGIQSILSDAHLVMIMH